MLTDVDCQRDQPNAVKNVSLYLTAPGSNPGARIEDNARTSVGIVHFGHVSRISFCYVACVARRSYVNCALRTPMQHLMLLNNYANCALRTFTYPAYNCAMLLAWR